MSTQTLDAEQATALVVGALEEMKAVDLKVIDVSQRSSFTDRMVIATGTSNRHVHSLADNVIQRMKEAGVRPLGSEGEQTAEWVLVDLGDVVVHVMLPRVRDFYNLEKLWSLDVADDQQGRNP